MKYKALLLDLDDTLTKSSKVYGKALKFSSDYLAQKYKLDENEFFKVVNEKHFIVSRNFPTVHTRHSRILVFRMALEDTVKDYDIAILPKVEDMYWDYFINNIELYPDVSETLEKIKKAGVKMAIVSDGSLSLRIRKAQAVDILRYMDAVVASEEVIFEKPFSAIFTLALSRLHLEPKDALMLGNSYKNDIRGAQLVGIKAGIFDPKEDGNLEGQDGTIVPDFTIHTYPEILNELGIK